MLYYMFPKYLTKINPYNDYAWCMEFYPSCPSHSWISLCPMSSSQCFPPKAQGELW